MKAESGKINLTGGQILEQLKWRYATKRYDPARKISGTDWAVLEEALILSPSSYGLQPYRFIVVTNREVREKLKTAAYNQPQITEASHLVVFAYKKTLNEADVERYLDRIAEVRNQSREALADFENVLKGAAKSRREDGTIASWNARQAYIALGILVETAALLKIDATPMEGIDPARFDEILGLTDYTTAAVCALGYRDAENDWAARLAKVRKPEAEILVSI